MRPHPNPVIQSLVAAHRNMERVLTLIHLKLISCNRRVKRWTTSC